MNNLKTSLLAGFMAMSGSLAAQDFPMTKETKKDLNTNLQYEGKDKIENMKGYKELVEMLSNEYEQREKNHSQYGDLGAIGCKTCKNIDHVPISLSSNSQVFNFKKDFYDKLLNKEDPIETEVNSFHRRVSIRDGEIMVDGGGQENVKTTFGFYDVFPEEYFEHFFKTAKDVNLLRSSHDLALAGIKDNDPNNTYAVRLAQQPEGEQLISMILDYYYKKIKNDFDTLSSQGVCLDKPSNKMFRFADKNGFILVPKLYILRDMNIKETLSLWGFYLRVPEEKPLVSDAGWVYNDSKDKKEEQPVVGWKYNPPKDTIPQITKEQIKETENEMNEIFEYGQKSIFKSNQSNFSNKSVEEGLDKLYEMLEKNPSLRIKVTGYYGGTHPTLPLERAKKVKLYLILKGIDEERIETEGGKEQIAKSIKIEVIK